MSANHLQQVPATSEARRGQGKQYQQPYIPPTWARLATNLQADKTKQLILSIDSPILRRMHAAGWRWTPAMQRMVTSHRRTQERRGSTTLYTLLHASYLHLTHAYGLLMEMEMRTGYRSLASGSGSTWNVGAVAERCASWSAPDYYRPAYYGDSRFTA